MLRNVIKSRTYQPSRTAIGSFNIEDELECGHVVTTKGSQGFAKRRKCSFCEDLKNGATIRIGGIKESWDNNTQMPIRTKVI